MEVSVQCPYCGESLDLWVDETGGSSQKYVEDCQVCCRPWRVTVRYGAAGGADVSVEPLDA